LLLTSSDYLIGFGLLKIHVQTPDRPSVLL